MPNRLIKESLNTSDKIASLSDFDFRLWVGLITIVDDAGRGDARPAVLKGRIFPLRERVTVKDVGAALARLAAKGCVSLYENDGKPYFWFPTWSKHQRIRDSKPKYPSPDDEKSSFAASCGELPRYAAIIQSESNPNPNPNPKRASAREDDFDRFWKAYPKKKAKDAAKKAFDKLNPDDALLETMLRAIAVQSAQKEWTKDNGQFIPYPSTWLSQGRWKDETGGFAQEEVPSEWSFFKTDPSEWMGE